MSSVLYRCGTLPHLSSFPDRLRAVWQALCVPISLPPSPSLSRYTERERHTHFHPYTIRLTFALDLGPSLGIPLCVCVGGCLSFQLSALVLSAGRTPLAIRQAQPPLFLLRRPPPTPLSSPSTVFSLLFAAASASQLSLLPSQRVSSQGPPTRCDAPDRISRRSPFTLFTTTAANSSGNSNRS